ncbi:hypothetical protein V8E54_004685 [Elaphomyces granulatus]
MTMYRKLPGGHFRILKKAWLEFVREQREKGERYLPNVKRSILCHCGKSVASYPHTRGKTSEGHILWTKLTSIKPIAGQKRTQSITSGEPIPIQGFLEVRTLPRIRRRCLVFCTPYAKQNPSKYNAANRYKACMDPGYLVAQVSHPQLCSLASDTNRICLKNTHKKTSLRRRAYTTEQQRRRKHDEDKWKSMYNILFLGEMASNLSMHLLT